MKDGGEVADGAKDDGEVADGAKDGRRGGRGMKDGGEVADGVTCFGTAENVPYCNGVDCPDWADCHGDRLRGYSASASNWREAFGL